jgi:predicted alpha/beta hydrolase
VKEAGQASAQQAVGARPRGHQGRRVVEGQRSLQAVSDVLLGWTTDPVDDTDYFIRQLWDAKGSFDTSVMRVAGFRAYVRACAWALARAHARTGDPATIAGYLGSADTFSTAMAEFAERYADQTERDHAALVAALADGRLPST